MAQGLGAIAEKKRKEQEALDAASGKAVEALKKATPTPEPKPKAEAPPPPKEDKPKPPPDTMKKEEVDALRIATQKLFEERRKAQEEAAAKKRR